MAPVGGSRSTSIEATGNISRGIAIFRTIALFRTIERVPALIVRPVISMITDGRRSPDLVERVAAAGLRTRRLRAAGLEDVGDASVYGTLRRLYAGGHLTSYVVPSEEGPHRKYYAVNDAGRALLAESTKTWRGFTDAMNALLGLDREEAA